MFFIKLFCYDFRLRRRKSRQNRVVRFSYHGLKPVATVVSPLRGFGINTLYSQCVYKTHREFTL